MLDISLMRYKKVFSSTSELIEKGIFSGEGDRTTAGDVICNRATRARQRTGIVNSAAAATVVVVLVDMVPCYCAVCNCRSTAVKNSAAARVAR